MVAARGGGCGIAIAPEVAGEAAPALTFSLTLFALLTWLVSWGLLVGWNNTFGPMLEGLANALKIDVWRVHVDPAGKLREIDHAVRGALQASVSTSDMAMGFWFHQTARLQGWVADETWKLARDTFHFGEWVVQTYGPLLVKTASTVVFPWPKLYRVIDSEIDKLLPKAERAAHSAAHAAVSPLYREVAVPHAGELGWIHRHWKALTAAVLGAGGVVLPLPALWPKFRASWKEIEAWRRLTNLRVKRLEGLLAAAGLATAVANMTGTRIGCWRGKGNIARALRHICGVPSWLLDVLLLGVIEGFIASDLCGFSNLLIRQAQLIRPALMELVDVEDALIGCGGTVKPLVFNLPPASLPPLQGVSPLAA